MELSLPGAFTSQMQTLLGGDYPAFIQALNGKPNISVRLNPRKPGASFPSSSPVPWCLAAVYLPERPAFFKDPLIYAGAYYVQEAASMIIGQLGDFSQDIRVLDLCASPGGKSTLLAAKMTPGSLLVANEVVRNRAEVLEENISRWGNPNVFVTHNHPAKLGQLRNYFDLILVDAPCSGEGMFRKDPKVIQHWSPKMVAQCAERQKEILASIIGSLAPGGRLIYSTCTYNRQENESIVQWLLDESGTEFEIVEFQFPAEWGLTSGDTEGYCPEMKHTYHCYPHKVSGEGFYFACLQKQSHGRKTADGNPKGKKHSRSAALSVLQKQDRSAATRLLKDSDSFEFFRRGDAVEVVPSDLADDYRYLSENLNLLKGGVRVGEIKGGKLVPDHDLAMSELQSDSVGMIELDKEQAMRYLSRDELSMDAEGCKDWAIVRHAGRNLGWVKVLPGRINNHLPKQLRIRNSLDYTEFEE